MNKQYILSIDQGTTGTTVIIFGKNGKILGKTNKSFTQYYPRPGWVEHNPLEIWNVTLSAIQTAVKSAKIKATDIATIGITNQRETTVLWDRTTSKPVYNAIVWQCRRTANICDTLKKAGLSESIRKKTGLVIDAYFSSTKIKWMFDNVSGLKAIAKKGNLMFGTIDSWLVWNLTGGKIHTTDVSNASRTMLFNINSLTWDKEILAELKIPRSILPSVSPSSGIIGCTSGVKNLPDGIPIAGIAGDQQAALFGQTSFSEGMAKCTYGTGAFLLMNTGRKPVFSAKGLLTTIGWQIGKEVTYALEGSVFICGAAIQWLRDELRIIKDAQETEKLAESVTDTGDVYFVPAFVGFGAPYWDMYARGAIIGITRGTNRNHIVRAALEAMAYQTKDILELMIKETSLKLPILKVDGGAAANNFLMQFQADILGAKVDRPRTVETTALGAALLAGLGAGVWDNLNVLKKIRQTDKIFLPKMSKTQRDRGYGRWKKAVERAKKWEI